ncbi:2,3-diaminopropionate biosynthesis protein SbnA [Niallia taxi]|uniref:2,3-diaminopropionate biosynthesis protein SbnA n=1 Tax=Niallia taxi TaxID=2499688 RepID=UPI003D2883BD
MRVYNNVLESVGATPMVRLKDAKLENINLFAKLEGYNPTGSIKDRAACEMIKHLLNSGKIKKSTTIIESSSGNFGVALANYCKYYGLKFICVVDPKILPINEFIIKSVGAEIVKVDKADESGGYLISRINKVKELVQEIEDSYWINQYENSENANAYGRTVGKEICDQVELDYIFLGVSSGGTITGISRYVKEYYPHSKIIAVDVKGSIIFGAKPGFRSIPGIGSSIVPPILAESYIDDVVIVSEEESVEMCRDLLWKHNIFAGGSSGSVLAGVNKYFLNKKIGSKPNVVTLFADRGERYFESLYSDDMSKILTSVNQ